MKVWPRAEEGRAKSFTEIYLVTHASVLYFVYQLAFSVVKERGAEGREGKGVSQTAWRTKGLLTGKDP